MTIARVAQDKFEYQDLTSLLFVLEGLDDPSIIVRSEPAVGEDTEVVATIGETRCTFDIQSKDEPAAFDLDRLAHHMAHPSAHKTDETLLDRLETAPDRIAVFVTSGRLRDDAVSFGAPLGWAGRPLVEASPSGATVTNFLQAFSKVDLTGKTYEARRKTHRKALAARLRPRAAQKIMRRVLVLDQITGASLWERCVDLIAARMRGSHAAAEGLMGDFLRIVREAKVSGGDIIPPARRLLERHRRRRFGSPHYLQRGSEDGWFKDLVADGVLLLAGAPRSGKTQTAEDIADRLLDRNYEVVRASDLQDARRLFYDDGAAPRAVFLDDPLGDGWSIPAPPGAYAALKALVAQASSTRLLLVAQNQTPLLTVANRSALAEVKTSGRAWIDLSATSSELAVRVWEDNARRADLPEAAIKRLSRALASGRETLDLGALTHLAFSGNVEEDTSVADMVAVALQGAADFGQDVAAGDVEAGTLLAAFAMATDEAAGIDETTLAFILNGGSRIRPAHMAKLARALSFGGPASAETFPSYKTLPVLTADQLGRVEGLENRRILVRSGDRLQLSHGFYRAAALGVVGLPAVTAAERHIAMLDRGLFCLDPRTSRSAARNLDRIWAAVPDGFQGRVVTLAIEGLNATYPGTRDLCWRFLTARLDRLSEQVRSDLPQWVRNAYQTDLDDLGWYKGEAWIRTGIADFSESRLFRNTRFEAARVILEGLEGEADYVLQPENADTALSYYEKRPLRLRQRAMRRLLALDEAVLRADAAKTWVKVPRARDAAVLDEIFAERHPRIATEILDGIASGWAKLPERRRNTLVSRMKTFISSPVVAVTLVDSLVLINRVEHYGETPPWPLFAALLPVLLDQLVDEGTGAEPRLFTAVEDSVAHLQPSEIVEICRSWIGWLTRTTDRQLRGDYAWGVIPILIEATRTSPQLRAGLLAPLFAQAGETGAAAMLVSEISHEWAALTAVERDLLRDLLSAKRRDELWLKAIVLTQHDPSPDLVVELIGEPLATTTRGVLAQFPNDLLDACLEVHLGFEPFGYLGLSRASRAPWRWVVQRLAADPAHRLGARCLRALVRQEKASALLRAVPAWRDRLDEVFDLLVRHHLGVAGGKDLRPVWVWMFAQASTEQKAAWDARLVDDVPGLVTDLSRLRRDLGLDFKDVPLTAALVTPDYRALQIATDLRDAPAITPEMIALTLDPVIDSIIGSAPALFGTLDSVKDLLTMPETKGHSAWAKLRAARVVAVERHHLIRKRKLSTAVVDLTRWSGPK